MIPVGAVTPRSPNYRPLVWSSRITALAAIVFAAAAVTNLMTASLALNLAFGCATTAIVAYLCLGRGEELALLRQIGRASIEERKQLDFGWGAKTPFGRLLEQIKEVVDRGEGCLRYDIRVDTNIIILRKLALNDFAAYTQKDLDSLLVYFEA